MYLSSHSQKKQSGFTIIELLVVIALIGTIASIVLVSLEASRTKARDTQRKAALNQIQVALELYRNDNGSFQVSGGGYLGGGQGWLSYENGSTYSTSVTRVLYNQGYLPAPLIEDPTVSPGYMIYVCNNGQSYALSATLENPNPTETAEAAASCNGAATTGTYGKNFVRKNG
jgi:prepilin-type N-terminal cleavage/methylation domain-containing protein